MLIAKDMSRVKACLPGRKLTAADRHGEGPQTIHERIKKCVREVAVPKLGHDPSNKSANTRTLKNVSLWQDVHLHTGDLSAGTLITSRQLALDFAASDAADLFGADENDPCDPEAKAFRHADNEQVAAYLAAKELLPSKMMAAFKKELGESCAPCLLATVAQHGL